MIEIDGEFFGSITKLSGIDLYKEMVRRAIKNELPCKLWYCFK
jgi:hypothetical protein